LTGVQGFAVVHPDDRAEHQARVEDAVRNGHGWHAEFRIVRPRDGEIVWIEERATVTRDQTTGACYVTGLAWDITDRKRAEAAADLERRLHARDGLRRQLLAAEEAERRRLARELHDQLGQQLTGMSLGLEEARRLAAGNDDRSGDDRVALLQRLERLQHLTRAMTTSARHLALELRPPELDDTGFENALDSYSAEWSTRFSVPSEVVIVGERDRALPSDVSSALYRIAQEALTNVAKHAKAASVSVIVEKLPAEVRLIIEDDGVGCDMEAAQARARRERRLGLAGIHERASILGGSAQIESSPGRGTTVFVRVPLGARFTPESNESVP
jgi:signal transduction histidine kinase